MIKRILITLGGEDPSNLTSWIISNLYKFLNKYHVHICIGPSHPNPKDVIFKSKKYLKHYTIYVSPISLVEPMSKCHIAMSAGGVTCYELIAARIAIGVIAIEEHQFLMQKQLVRNNLGLSLGNFKSLRVSNLIKTLLLLDKKHTINRLVNRGNFIIKESGARMISNKIKSILR